jgi:malate synthase
VVDQLDGEENHQVHSARKIFEEVALSDDFVDFLTLPAYELIN